jgi:UDP-GlcNAc:undecaprenyl-phosphate GlcNAc-1-phosphate transferase
LTNAFLWQLAITFIVAYLGTRILIPINIRLSKKAGMVAIPNERSIHTVPTPTAGGLSFGIVIILMQIGLGIFSRHSVFGINLIQLGCISILLVIFGLIDDRYQSRVRYKLLGQIIVALFMFYAGYKVTYLTNPMGNNLLLGWLSLPVTIFWFLLTMNAINLIDGLDGLASGITCIVSAVLAVVGFTSQNQLVLFLSILLLATNLAFIKYNFFPAKIFMGDTGSLLIGLNIAAISTASNSTFKGITTMTLMVPVIVMAIPILDTVLAVFRRLGTGSIFRADKAHLHHYLLKVGLSQKSIALIIYFITFLFGLAAIGFSFSSQKILFSLVVILMAVLIILTYIIIHRGQK